MPRLGKNATLDALAVEYDEFNRLLASLTDDEFATQSLCTEWSVQDVAAHVAELDKASLTGTFFLALLPGRDVEDLNRKTVASWRGRRPAELRRAVETWGRRQQRLLRTLSPALWNIRLPTPLGRLRGASLAKARVYDLWCHNRDIAVPTENPEPDAARTRPAIEWMLDAMGQMVGPQLSAHDSKTIGIEITGPVAGTWQWRVGDIDIPETDTIADSDTQIVTDTHTFVVAGSGRDRPADAAADGRIKVAGDEALGAAFVEHFYIY